MTRITRTAGCGNSPKNTMVEDIVLGLERGVLDPKMLAETVTWRRCDGTTASSREAAGEGLAGRSAPKAITIERVTSHGKVGAASGQTVYDDRTERFSHVVTFTSVAARQIAEIDSFRKREG